MLNAKAELRTRLRREYAGLPQTDFSLNVLRLDAFRAAKTVALYRSVGLEAGTAALISACADRCILLPRCKDGRMEFCEYTGTLVKDDYAIPAPPDSAPAVDINDIDFMLVPALAYDRHGFRLGRGAGCYDRALACYCGFSAGLIRGRFLFDLLPTGEFDRRVDTVVTEEGAVILE